MSKFLVSNGCSRRVVCRQHQVASSANKKSRPKIVSLRHISSAEPQSKLQILTANNVGSRFDFHFGCNDLRFIKLYTGLSFKHTPEYLGTIRHGFPRKTCCSFGFRPNEERGGPCPNFFVTFS